MQQIALFVLPKNTGDEKTDDVTSNVNDTQGSRVSTGGEDVHEESDEDGSDHSTLEFESNPSRPASPADGGLGISFLSLEDQPAEPAEAASETDIEAEPDANASEASEEASPPPDDTTSDTERSLRLQAQEFRLLRVGPQRWKNVNLDIASRAVPNTHRHRSSRRRLYIAEHKTYDLPGIPSATVERWIRLLAEILHEVLPTGFLRCEGYILDAANKKYYILSEFPSHINTIPKSMDPGNPDEFRPFTLGELLQRDPANFAGEFSTIKTEIAKNTALALRRIHEYGLVHKNVRSSSILIFTDHTRSNQSPNDHGQDKYLDVRHPYLTDWGYLQLDELPLSVNQKMAGKKAYSHEHPYLSIYQHPHLATHPNTRYEAAFDIYAFGLILIEIGLWKPLPQILGPKTLSEYTSARTLSQTSAPANFAAPLTRRLADVRQTELRAAGPQELCQAVELCLGAPKWAEKNRSAAGECVGLWAKITDKLAAWERALQWQLMREREDVGKKGVKMSPAADQGKGWNVVGGRKGKGGNERGGGGGSGVGSTGKGPTRGYKGKGKLA